MGKKLAEQIRVLIKDGKLFDAIEIILKSPLKKEGIQYAARLKDLREKVRMGLIRHEEEVYQNNIIRKAILDTADLIEFPLQKFNDQPPLLGPVYRYLCDRFDQRDVFYEKFLQRKNERFFFCVVHGYRKQSHKGLFKRFEHEYIIGNDGKVVTKFIILPEKQTMIDYQKSTLISLFHAFGLKQLSINEMTIDRLILTTEKWDNEQLAIHFQLKSNRWKDFLPKLLLLFIKEFCHSIDRVNSKQRFYFFFNIIYENKKDTRSILDRLLRKAHPEEINRKKIKNALNRLDIPQYICLPELEPVPLSYIEDWMNFVADTDEKKDKLLKKYFPEKNDKYDMEDVEKRLGRIVKKHNQKYIVN